MGFVCLFGLVVMGAWGAWGGSQATEYVLRSVIAKEVGDILRVPCMRTPADDVSWRYEAPSVIDYARIDGIFLRYHCPGLDTFLWDRHAQRAYLVNPFLFAAGFLEDLSHSVFPADTQETTTRRALYKEIRDALGSRKQAVSHAPVRAGCVNFDYSRTRRCVGRRDLRPANTTLTWEPPVSSDDEASSQSKPLATQPPVLALSNAPPRRVSPTRGRRRHTRLRRN
uniref:UL1 n=1 Tax=Human herpesvirus 2 TaxID=10310 RepID=A0A410TJ05_HHV2|nr:UL1 [Human alphaherpesvirus 2]